MLDLANLIQRGLGDVPLTGAALAQNGYSTRTTVTRNVEPATRDAPGNFAAGGVSGAALGAGVGCPSTQFAPWFPGTTKSATIKSHQLAARHVINQTITC